MNWPPTDILTAGPAFRRSIPKWSNCNQIASRLNMGCNEKWIRKRLWSDTKNKPSENRLFLGLREECLENCCPRIWKGKFQDSMISSCFLIAVKNGQRTTYGRKIANPTLWDTKSAMKNEANPAYNNTSGTVLKFGNCLAWSSGES